jgi:amidophosphoribosyltransferase
MGINIPSVKELIAADRTVEEIAEKLGVDSLQYLSVDGLKAAVQNGLRGKKTSIGHCTACLTNEYPVPIDF